MQCAMYTSTGASSGEDWQSCDGNSTYRIIIS
jgi:hypothetical protein